MYAVIETGGKQYRVKEGDVFFVEKLPGEKEELVVFDQVLLISKENGESPLIGNPYLENAKVACEIVEQFRGKKILVFKFKRRKKYRRRRGHRQYYTRLKVLQISPDGNLTFSQKSENKEKDQTEQVKGNQSEVKPVDFEDAVISQTKKSDQSE